MAEVGSTVMTIVAASGSIQQPEGEKEYSHKPLGLLVSVTKNTEYQGKGGGGLCPRSFCLLSGCYTVHYRGPNVAGHPRYLGMFAPLGLDSLGHCLPLARCLVPRLPWGWGTSLFTASLQGSSVIHHMGCVAATDVGGILGPNVIGCVIHDIDSFRPGLACP